MHIDFLFGISHSRQRIATTNKLVTVTELSEYRPTERTTWCVQANDKARSNFWENAFCSCLCFIHGSARVPSGQIFIIKNIDIYFRNIVF